jgi:MoaA/NifB/PqqE/SkfB family radical SAM enzyme
MRVAFSGKGIWRDVGAEPSLAFAPCRVPASARYLDLVLALDLPWAETGRYEHSTLRYQQHEAEARPEGVVCLHVAHVGRSSQRVRVLLPDGWAGRPVRMRLFPAPRARAGSYRVLDARFRGDSCENEAASRLARLEALKDRVRRAVARSEADRFVVLDHLPHSLSIELTARCNLTCPHCSSHGTPDLDRRYNAMPEMAVNEFEALADEVFSSLTTVGLVGRGEPLLVSRRLWAAVVSKLREHHVRMTLVTNGTLVRRRLTPEVIPYLETVHVSVDGGSEETFAANRVGATLGQVVDALRYLNDVSRGAKLARRPRIGVSWTLKANNVAELPAFVERAIAIGLDQLTVRHLLVFHGKERSQSVVDRPDLVNEPLRRTYELLARHGVRSDCPPLVPQAEDDSEPAHISGGNGSVPVRITPKPAQDGCMFVRRTAVIHADGVMPTCSAPFAAAAGRLDHGTGFLGIWNGPVLKTVRATLGTPDEWAQCRHCWYREGRYESQRRTFDGSSHRYDLTEPDRLTVEAWDFEDYRQ